MRDAFIAWLARLVADGAITEDEAKGMLAEFDRGERRDWDAPLSLGQAIQGRDDSQDDAILAALLALLTVRRIGRLESVSLTATYANLGLINGVQVRFEAEAARLARALTGGQLSIADWQRGMLRNLQVHGGMAASLSQRTRGVADMPHLDSVLRLQSAYLSRFADTLALRMPSEAAVASRSALYGNSLRSLYFEEIDTQVAERLPDGWVVQWHSRDDGHTCPLCVERDGRFYLPGTRHPRPGDPDVCFGRCRCSLEYQFLPEKWRQLQGF